MPPMSIRKHERAKKGTMKRLLKMLFKDYKWPIIFSFLCIFANVGTNLSVSVFLKNITEVIMNTSLGFEEQMRQITILLFILAAIYLVGIFATWFWNRSMAIVTQKFLNTFRKKLFDHMETLPIKYFDRHPHGEIMSLYTNDIDTIRQFVSQSLPSLVMAIGSVIACLIAMLIYSLWLTLVVVVCGVGMLVVTKKIGGKSARFFIKQQKSLGAVEGNIEESIKGLKVIKVFSHEAKSFEAFEKLNNELCANATKANINGNIVPPIMMNIGNFIYVLTAILGCILIGTNSFNVSLTGIQYNLGATGYIPLVVSFLAMSRMFTNQMNTFAQQVTFIVMGMAGASRCFDLLDEPSEIDEGYVTLVNIKYHEDGTFEETNEKTRHYAWKHPHKATGQVTYTELKGDIVLDHVDFAYEPGKLVLKDVSIYAHPGQKIAFVGATGAGKTTITNLINRFYDLADGKCRYDGININKIKKSDLRRSLGIVLQDTNLFTGTVMDNIRYGRLDATDEECINASKIANAYDFITRLPEGFNTMLSGDGSNLSQGQRQLLSIARAAVADAPVMILDEATSSIDTRTEKLVQKGTDQLMEGRTVFVIAHRLSTVQNSDAIMVLDHGSIIERGDHESLLKEQGVYYKLYTGAFELD